MSLRTRVAVTVVSNLSAAAVFVGALLVAQAGIMPWLVEHGLLPTRIELREAP